MTDIYIWFAMTMANGLVTNMSSLSQNLKLLSCVYMLPSKANLYRFSMAKMASYGTTSMRWSR